MNILIFNFAFEFLLKNFTYVVDTFSCANNQKLFYTIMIFSIGNIIKYCIYIMLMKYTYENGSNKKFEIINHVKDTSIIYYLNK
jgi:hypothetical protein